VTSTFTAPRDAEFHC